MPDEPTLPPDETPARLIAGVAPMSEAPTIAPTGSLSSHDAGDGDTDSSPVGFAAGARRLGNYELQEELARGGMGVVFRAKQVSLSRIVALKMILSGPLAGSAALQRFHIEASAAAQLDHPNIVPIYEVGEDSGQHFFSMKLVEGGSVAEHLNRYLSNPRLTAEMLAKVARAVHYAHQRGILHRDLKPANILLDSASEPLVSDFGLAKWDQADVNLTHAETCLGTPGYMAPEQARGSRGMSTAADIYGLGAILYQCLTGVPPFTGGNVAEVLRKLVEEEPLPPRSLGKNVPLDLEIICLKCLSKELPQRYSSAEALADDLSRFVNGEPITARAAGSFERAWRWCRRKPALAGAMAAVVLATMMTIVILSVAVVKVSTARTEERRQHASRMFESANARFSSGDAPQGLLTLTEALSLAEQSGFTSLEKTLRRHIGVWQAAMPSLAFAVDHGTPVTAVACSAAGNRIFTAGDNTLRAWNEFGSEIGAPILHESLSRMIAASPQGDLVALAGESGEVAIWNLASGQRVRLFELGTPIATLTWSADGHTLAISTEQPSLKIAQLDPLLGDYQIAVTSTLQALRFSETGDRLLTGAQDGSIVLFDLKSRSAAASMKLTQPIRAVQFQRDGTIAVVTDRAALLKRQLTGVSSREIPVPEGTSAIALSENGRMFTGGDESIARMWDLHMGSAIGFPIRHPSRITAAACSDDGQFLVAGCVDGSVRVWKTSTGEADHSPFKGEAGIQCMTLSRDQRVLAAGDDSGVISRWNLHSGEQLPPIRLGSPVMSLAFAANDTLLAGDQDGNAWRFNPGSGEQQAKPFQAGSAGSWLDTLAVSPDGGRAVVGYNDGLARIWILSEQTWLDARLEHEEAITSARFSPDGRKILTTSRDALARLWDAISGSPLGDAMVHEKTVWAAIFSPAGDRVVTASEDRSVRFWNAANGSPIGSPIELEDDVLLLATDPGGGRLAAACRNGTIQVWDVSNWSTGGLTPLSRVRLSGTATTLQFSSSGDLLLAGGSDNAARLIDVATGTLAGVPLQHSGVISAAVFDDDGATALTAGADGAIKVWPVAAAKGSALELSNTAQKITGVTRGENGSFRLLSPEDWRKRFLLPKPATQPIASAN